MHHASSIGDIEVLQLGPHCQDLFETVPRMFRLFSNDKTSILVNTRSVQFKLVDNSFTLDCLLALRMLSNKLRINDRRTCVCVWWLVYWQRRPESTGKGREVDTGKCGLIFLLMFHFQGFAFWIPICSSPGMRCYHLLSQKSQPRKKAEFLGLV